MATVTAKVVFSYGILFFFFKEKNGPGAGDVVQW
jgi:hypothetical protein